VDPTAATAKQTFEKLQLWFPAKPNPPHIGDAAYIDKSDAIHVLKGKVRFYINVTPASTNEKPLLDLATFVTSRL